MDRSEHFYHGTTEHFAPGDTVLPASQHGGRVTFHSDTSPDQAYATESPDDAWDYAELSHAWKVNDSRPPFPVPRVYKVAPVGQYETDPTGKWDGDRRSSAGWRVVSEEQMPEHMGPPEDWRT
jgi:hypothetical protein